MLESKQNLGKPPKQHKPSIQPHKQFKIQGLKLTAHPHIDVQHTYIQDAMPPMNLIHRYGLCAVSNAYIWYPHRILTAFLSPINTTEPTSAIAGRIEIHLSKSDANVAPRNTKRKDSPIPPTASAEHYPDTPTEKDPPLSPKAVCSYSAFENASPCMPR